MKHKYLVLTLMLLFAVSGVWAEGLAVTGDSVLVDSTELYPAQVSQLMVVDTDNDHGHSITVTWETSADDGGGKNIVLGYDVYRAESPDGPFLKRNRAAIPSGAGKFVDLGSKDPTSGDYMADFIDYWYYVDAVTTDPSILTSSNIEGPVQSSGQIFHSGRTPVLLAILIFGIIYQ